MTEIDCSKSFMIVVTLQFLDFEFVKKSMKCCVAGENANSVQLVSLVELQRESIHD